METSQRVVKEIIRKDNATISALLDSMQRLLGVLNSYHDVMQDLSKLAEKFGTPDLLTGDIINVNISYIKLFCLRSKH